MKYPGVIIFCKKSEEEKIEQYFKNDKQIFCNYFIFTEPEFLKKIFNPNFPILLTFGNKDDYLENINSIVPKRLLNKWIHFEYFLDPIIINIKIQQCFENCLIQENKILSSFFTTCYKSYDKIKRAYKSLENLSQKDWEWVILDDSPEDEHFKFLTELFENDDRIRLYKRSKNSGNIGNVKNEAVLLCRGKYVIELDHDDEMMPKSLEQIENAFESNEEVGFVYMNYSNVYENKKNFFYGDFFSYGYAGYYMQKVDNNWIYVASTPNINNDTLMNIVAVPNHPRCWRKDFLIKIGNYNEYYSISDDYELFLRTVMSKTKIIKINELGYIQYMNDGNNNFSLIRNSEINRLCSQIIYPYYKKQGIEDVMEQMGCKEEKNVSQVWKRKKSPKFLNKIHGNKNQIVFIGFETLFQYIDKKYNFNKEYDYILLENKLNINIISNFLNFYKLDFFKFYCLLDLDEKNLVRYFEEIIKNDESNVEIIFRDSINFCPLETNLDSLKIKNENLKVVLITPSIRPSNLLKIKESLNFDLIEKWIIVYDQQKIETNPFLFKDYSKIVELLIKNNNSTSGNAQRNHALDYMENEMLNKEYYVYFLDDDTKINENLFTLFGKLESKKAYTFKQKRSTNVFPYLDILVGNIPEVYMIDTAQLLISSELIKGKRWILDKYNSDGHFIKESLAENKENWIYINEILTIYNSI